MEKKIRVLIVDDAAFMRKTIRKIIETQDCFSVVGIGKNGQEAIKLNNELKPDIITLDIDMPVMDGIKALKHMMIQRPVPVVIVSSLSYESNVTFEAFKLGVIDFIPKPTGAISKELEQQKAYLCDVLKKAAKVKVKKLHRVEIQNLEAQKDIAPVASNRIVFIGSSLGGPNSIIRIVSRLPSNINFSVIVMLQISSRVMDSFIQKLDKISKVKVARVQDNVVLNKGCVYISNIETFFPVSVHEVGNTYVVRQETEKVTQTPINHLMTSASDLEKVEAAGVLLSGFGEDGLEGIYALHHKNGKTIIQSLDSALYPEKPELALQKGHYSHILDDHEIAEKLAQYI